MKKEGMLTVSDKNLLRNKLQCALKNKYLIRRFIMSIDYEKLIQQRKYNLSNRGNEINVPKVRKGRFSCPSCRSNNTDCKRDIGYAIMIIICITFGIGLIMIPFLPYKCECYACGFKWKS